MYIFIFTIIFKNILIHLVLISYINSFIARLLKYHSICKLFLNNWIFLSLKLSFNFTDYAIQTAVTFKDFVVSSQWYIKY